MKMGIIARSRKIIHDVEEAQDASPQRDLKTSSHVTYEPCDQEEFSTEKTNPKRFDFVRCKEVHLEKKKEISLQAVKYN